MKTALQKKPAREFTILPHVRASLLDPFFWDSDLMADWIPRMDVCEDKNQITITVSVPDVKPEDITLEMDDHSLIIQGKTESEKEEEGKTWYRKECESGSFSRTYMLPNNVDRNTISAKAKNGTLVISLPKTKAAQKKKIEIK